MERSWSTTAEQRSKTPDNCQVVHCLGFVHFGPAYAIKTLDLCFECHLTAELTHHRIKQLSDGYQYKPHECWCVTKVLMRLYYAAPVDLE